MPNSNITAKANWELARGDADGNGEVNISDVTYIQKHIVGFITLTDEQIKSADVDNSGKISIRDATHIQKYIAKLFLRKVLFFINHYLFLQMR
jgi:hypothetical protein